MLIEMNRYSIKTSLQNHLGEAAAWAASGTQSGVLAIMPAQGQVGNPRLSRQEQGSPAADFIFCQLSCQESAAECLENVIVS